MLRRFLVILIRRAILLLLLICLGCSAQSAPPELARKIERQVRSYYGLSSDVNVTVGAIAPSGDWPGFDSITVTVDNGETRKDYQFLISKDRNTMLRMVKFDLSKDPFADVMKKIDVSGRPTRGAANAKVVVVNYDDLECPFCSRLHATLFPEILKEYGDRVTFIYKDYPLAEIHPWAIHAAVDANCLAAQNSDAYWDLADYIHSHQDEIKSEKSMDDRFAALDKLTLLQGEKHRVDAMKLQSCIKAQDERAVRSSMKEGDDVGVSATPTLFVNGEKIDGAVPASELRAALDRALRDAGEPVPQHGAAASGPASK